LSDEGYIMLDIKNYEDMAMFDLPEDERSLLGRRLGSLAGAFGALDGIDACGAEPLLSVLELRNVMREDKACKLIARDEILANAPEQYDGYFQVPGTLE